MILSFVYLVGGSRLCRYGLRVYLEGTPFEVVRVIEVQTNPVQTAHVLGGSS